MLVASANAIELLAVGARLIPGAAGGLTWFLLAWERRNDKKRFVRRGVFAIVGGALVGRFIHLSVSPIPHETIAFLLGVSRPKIIEGIPKWVRRILVKLKIALQDFLNEDD